MEALFILIPLSLVAIGAAIWFFFRMSASGQFDDTEGPAYSILLDDDRPRAAQGADDDSPVSTANACRSPTAGASSD
ncbi:MAG: cbb3-type cytochrome oxidase assembly protein CcoS [Burkholderiaceae bacterium]